jgi:hypothetical protein
MGHDVTPLIMVVTGSHSWNLARPDSDTDVRGVYGWSTPRALSLYPGRDNIEGNGDVDFQAYELAKALRMLCAANGNVVEMLHNPLVVHNSEWGERLQTLARHFLTKRLAGYYLGYADSQRKRAMRNRGGKALIYTYREMYSGLVVMAEGRIIFDFTNLRPLAEARWLKSDVLAWAMENRYTPTTEAIMDAFAAEWEELSRLLIQERDASRLPEREPAVVRDLCDAELYDYRMTEGNQ